MPPISPIRMRRPASSRGTTLVEMVVVVTVLALVSAMVTPYLAGMKATSDHRDAVAGIRRILPMARERAIRNAAATQVVFDESAGELQVQDMAADGTPTTVYRQDLDAIDPQTLQVEGREATSADFALSFTPGGHSNGGGIQFRDFSIFTDTSGVCRTLDGPLPNADDESWQAGDLEKRQ